MSRVKGIKIGISGVRGIVGETLSTDNIINLSRAFATLIGGGKIAIGTDSRVSGEFVKSAVISGLLFSKITPVDLGVVSTPTLEIYIKEKKLSGGIIITASHNLEDWNGLKFVSGKGIFLSPFKILNLVDIYHQRGYIIPNTNEFPYILDGKEPFSIHTEKINKILDKVLIRKKKFNVLMDTGGGVGSFFSEKFLKSFNCNVTMINNDVGENFCRPPEPIPENLTDCSKAMKKGNFDIGFAQDPDGDRLAIIDETGSVLSGDLTLAILLYSYLLNKKPGTIVVNLSTSRLIEFIANMLKMKVLKSPVGEINVVEMMKSSDAIAGGEGNGGIIIPEVHYCRDSFTGMGLILDTMAKTGKKVSEIIKIFPKYKRVSKKIPFSMSGAQKIISVFKEEYPDGNTHDGIRVDKDDYWFHIRPSNTEPILRVVAEGKDDSILELVKELEKKIRAI